MKKIVRLTESDLVRLVKRVISENKENDFNTVEGRINALSERIKFDYSILSDIEKIYQWIENDKKGIMNYLTDEFEDLPEKLVRTYEKNYSNFTDDQFKEIYKGLKRKMNNE